jgi:reverse gyrase
VTSTADPQRKDTADRIAQRLTEEGHSVASLHGDKMTNERDGILDAFRDGKTKVLITTNVVARGIDIQQVNMVVNYDVPDLGPSGDYKPDIETYIHRIGQLPSPVPMSKANDQVELVDLAEKGARSSSLMIRGLWRMFSTLLIPSRNL